MSFKYFGSREDMEIAIGEYLQNLPSMAPATVPDYMTSSPILLPKFIPENTISGILFISPRPMM